jgi:hypothetical protein
MTEMEKLQYLNQRIAHRFIYGTGMTNQLPESIEGRMNKAREYIDRMKECANRNKEGSKNNRCDNTNSEV